MGLAIRKVLKKTTANVEMWDKDPAKVLSQKPIDEATAAADIVLLCLPSWGMREALGDIAPYLSKDSVVVSLAKGIEKGTLKTTDQLLQELLPRGRNFAVLSGPMLAEELMKG